MISESLKEEFASLVVDLRRGTVKSRIINDVIKAGISSGLDVKITQYERRQIRVQFDFCKGKDRVGTYLLTAGGSHYYDELWGHEPAVKTWHMHYCEKLKEIITQHDPVLGKKLFVREHYADKQRHKKLEP
jgi:hypothetical protein